MEKTKVMMENDKDKFVYRAPKNDGPLCESVMMEKTKALVIRMTKELHHEMKKLCVEAGMTMQDVMTELIEKFLKIGKK